MADAIRKGMLVTISLVMADMTGRTLEETPPTGKYNSVTNFYKFMLLCCFDCSQAKDLRTVLFLDQHRVNTPGQIQLAKNSLRACTCTDQTSWSVFGHHMSCTSRFCHCKDCTGLQVDCGQTGCMCDCICNIRILISVCFLKDCIVINILLHMFCNTAHHLKCLYRIFTSCGFS